MYVLSLGNSNVRIIVSVFFSSFERTEFRLLMAANVHNGEADMGASCESHTADGGNVEQNWSHNAMGQNKRLFW